MRNLIIGYGTVGKATAKLLHITEYMDTALESNYDERVQYDYGIICVKREDLDKAIEFAKTICKHIVIRTTINPKKAILISDYTYWPEFNVTETNSKGSNLVVITKDETFRNYLLQFIDAHTIINTVSHTEAALIKVWNNYRLLQEALLAKKLHSICSDLLDVDFDHIRNVIKQDTRHHDNYTGEIDSKCFDLAEEIVEVELW